MNPQVLNFIGQGEQMLNALTKRAPLQRLQIGIHGGEASLSHTAAQALFSSTEQQQIELRFLFTAEAVLRHLATGEIDGAIIANQPANGEQVQASIQHFVRYNPELIGTLDIPVNLHLLAQQNTDPQAYRQLISHPYAITQCMETLHDEFPQLRWGNLDDSNDTAESARQLSQGVWGPETVVIGSRAAAEKYNLKIVREGINDDPTNYTTFFFCRQGFSISSPSPSTWRI